MNFVAIDVETASQDIASICQIGIVCASGGKIVDEWETLINPEIEFFMLNTNIHKITADMVRDAPIFRDVSSKIHKYLSGKVVVCHGHFDKFSVQKACGVCGLNLQCDWLDTTRVARGTWEDAAKFGAGLAAVCARLDIPLQNHDALSDARAAAYIAIKAAQIHGTTVSELLKNDLFPVASRYDQKMDSPNPKGPFFGKRIVFTGDLKRTRLEVTSIAFELGFKVLDVISKKAEKADILVIGSRGERYLQYGGKSKKQKDAERLITEGANIRLLSEDDFEILVQQQ